MYRMLWRILQYADIGVTPTQILIDAHWFIVFIRILFFRHLYQKRNNVILKLVIRRMGKHEFKRKLAAFSDFLGV